MLGVWNSIMKIPMLAALALSIPSTAQTFVVDDTPGVGADFRSIAAAIGSIPPGAVLDVRPGTYSGFRITQDVRIVGSSAADVEVTSPVEIDAIATSQPIVLSRLQLSRGIAVTDVAAPVILDNLTLTFGSSQVSQALELSNATDVRAARVEGAVVRVTDSRLQAGNCEFFGSNSVLNDFSEPGLEVQGTSLVHLDQCSLTGADGLDCPYVGFCTPLPNSAGSGGHGAIVGPHAVLRAVRCTLRGGHAGMDDVCGCLFYFAERGSALRVEGRAELWATDLFTGAAPDNYVLEPGGAATEATPYPSLQASNTTASASAPITLTYSADPGSSRRLIAGRLPVLVDVPGLTIGRLVTINRLGSLGASTQTKQSLSFPQPPWSVGTVFYGQVSRTASDGLTELSNSIAIVAR